MTLSDNTIAEENSGNSFNILGKKGLNVPKKDDRNVLKNPGIAFKMEQMLVLHLHLEAPKRLYHHYQRR